MLLHSERQLGESEMNCISSIYLLLSPIVFPQISQMITFGRSLACNERQSDVSVAMLIDCLQSNVRADICPMLSRPSS